MGQFDLITISEMYFSSLNTEFKKIGCKSIQPYFPILSLFPTHIDNSNNSDNSNKLFQYNSLQNTNSVIKLNEKYDKTDEDNGNYIKTIYNCNIFNNETKQVNSHNIFIKIIPILEPVQYLLNEFHNENNNYNEKAIDSINKYNNTAYTEVFANYLLSLLSNKNKCPTFPSFYGTYSSIINPYEYDATHEWDDICDTDEFLERVENGEIIYNFKEMSGGLYESILDEPHDLTDLDLESVSLDKEEEEEEEGESSGTEEGEEEENENIHYSKWLKIYNYPVQLCLMEKMDFILEDILEQGNISNIEWISILFQIVYALTLLQQKFNMIHNDLHSDNIMFIKTKKKFLYYSVNDKLYVVPTFGKIVKIIDFARATYNIGKLIFFPSVFEVGGDAEGQYSQPQNGKWANEDVTPNPSFDLARLATTIYEYFNEDSDIHKLLYSWTKTKNNEYLLFDDDSFELYVKISRECDNAIPKEQLKNTIFNIFLVNYVEEIQKVRRDELVYSISI